MTAKQQGSMRRRFLLHLSVVLLLILGAARLYMLGMEHLEHSPRGFWPSLEVVFESLTSTGYGRDAGWQHPLMNLFVIVLQLSGLTLLLSVFPLYLVPFFESRFEPRLPVSAPEADGHVLIFRQSRAIGTVLGELERAEQQVLVLEGDETEARRLLDQGHAVVHRQLDDEGLLAAGLLRARSLIAGGSDEENASLALAARQLGYGGEIITLVGDPTYLDVMRMAGSSEVLAPRQLLAVALAARASERVSPTLAGAHQLGEKLEVFQLRVGADSRLAGLDLRQAAVGARTGAIVIGQWVGGRLITSPGPEMILQPGGILVVAGSHESLEALVRLEAGARPVSHGGPVLVVGHGEVGAQVVELLRQAGETVRVIDRREGPGVDTVGDVLDPATLSAATLDRAQAVVLAIDSDVSTLFATVIIRDRSHSVPILARVNEAENLEKIHRAGADFALSFSQVAGSLLVSRLLGRQALELDPQLKLLKAPAGALVGRHPADLDVRARTGCSVVAVERGDSLLTNFEPDFRFAAEDAVFICGSQQGVERFQADYGV